MLKPRKHCTLTIDVWLTCAKIQRYFSSFSKIMLQSVEKEETNKCLRPNLCNGLIWWQDMTSIKTIFFTISNREKKLYEKWGSRLSFIDRSLSHCPIRHVPWPFNLSLFWWWLRFLMEEHIKLSPHSRRSLCKNDIESLQQKFIRKRLLTNVV